MRTILYTILVAILATFFFQACSKEDVELQPSEKVATQDTVTGQFYWAEAAQGTSWLPGSLGGTYYPLYDRSIFTLHK